MKTIRVCPGCGTELLANAPAGLCPKCLLQSEAPTLSPGEPEAASVPRPILVPGENFGAYRILRLLGHGGMGEVFAAEQSDTGRRLALKVMSHALASDQDRKRFLREGRLAASVNHPNVVYIHGSEEVAGVPVIIMELVQGGTLKDRLKKEGPVPVAEAIKMALQLISGLEAASNAGVLHRDIKPANCFVTADGTVKVGDFGLSISTLARGESLLTATGSVLGTPAYASPEQLRGEDLDIRSDIYSMGATLYHLLTGRPPFPATDFVKLITEVLDKPATPPKALRGDLPSELSKVVLRCLAKDRNRRFQTYAELRDALLPFGAVEVTPATPARRFLAGLMDDVIAYGPSVLFMIYWSFDPLDKLMRERTLASALVWAPFYGWYLAYYAVAEGLWGAGFGKSICGLRVVDAQRQPPGVPRALLRTAIYMVPMVLPSFLMIAFVPMAEMQAALARDAVMLTDWVWLPLFLLLFVTMRRRNGYAALHDLWSATRVILKPQSQPRPQLAESAPGATRYPAGPGAVSVSAPSAASLNISPLAMLGPYEIRGSLWKKGGEELLSAFDPLLRRQVWIHLRPLPANSLHRARHDLSRPGRLRWLTGGQTQSHLWEAYDTVDGRPLLRPGSSASSWNAVRFWLLDLSEELDAALADPETAPLLALDRVWLTSNGGALLLDFPAPGLAPDGEGQSALRLEGLPTLQQFLDLFARRALTGSSSPPATPPPLVLPLPAQHFLRNLANGGFSRAGFIVGNLHSLIAKPAEVTRAWRAASLALIPAAILAAGLLVAGMVSFERIRWERWWNAAQPGAPSLRTAVEVYETAIEEVHELSGRPGAEQANTNASNLTREAELARVFLEHHFASILTNDLVLARPEFREAFSESTRARLRSAVSGNPPAPADLQEAERVLPERIAEKERQTRLVPIWIMLGMGIFVGVLAAVAELISAAGFGQSPLLRLFGLALVDGGGEAGRGRLLRRWFIGWGALGVAGFLGGGSAAVALAGKMFPAGEVDLTSAVGPAWIAGSVVGGLLIAFIAHTILHPSRSVLDRLVGTCVVPR